MAKKEKTNENFIDEDEEILSEEEEEKLKEKLREQGYL